MMKTLVNIFTAIVFATASVSISNGQTLPRKCSSEAVPDARLAGIETQLDLILGDSKIAVNIYDNNISAKRITFVVLHHDEQTGLKLSKQKILEKGGRLIEVVSCSGGVDAYSYPARELTFRLNGISYSIDPNRIFTEQFKDSQDRVLSGSVVTRIKQFRTLLLKEIFPNIGRRNPLRRGELFLASVHNNTDSSADPDDKTNIVTAKGWLEVNGEKVQKDGPDIDDFFLVTDISGMTDLYSHFTRLRINGRAFNVAAQQATKRKILLGDDGSLSVYCGINRIPYINVEAQHGHPGADLAQKIF